MLANAATWTVLIGALLLSGEPARTQRDGTRVFAPINRPYASAAKAEGLVSPARPR
jgi:hypothetical protein